MTATSSTPLARRVPSFGLTRPTPTHNHPAFLGRILNSQLQACYRYPWLRPRVLRHFAEFVRYDPDHIRQDHQLLWNQGDSLRYRRRKDRPSTTVSLFAVEVEARDRPRLHDSNLIESADRWTLRKGRHWPMKFTQHGWRLARRTTSMSVSQIPIHLQYLSCRLRP